MNHLPPRPVEELVAHAEFVRRLAGALVGGAHSAEDVAQEMWLAAAKRPPQRLSRAWLASVTRRQAARHHRTRIRRAKREARAARPESVPDATSGIAKEEKIRLLGEALCELPLQQREVIVHRSYDGLPPRVIARQLSVPVNTVRSRIRLGLDRLRKTLDRESNGRRDTWIAALAPLACPPVSAVPMIPLIVAGCCLAGAGVWSWTAANTSVSSDSPHESRVLADADDGSVKKQRLLNNHESRCPWAVSHGGRGKASGDRGAFS